MINQHADIIGLISDTHGVLRPEALKVFSDCDLILHAGDIGSERIIKHLGKVAPVVAVHGNMDALHLCHVYPRERSLQINGVNFYLTHIPTTLLPEIVDAQQSIVVFGHTHRPDIQESYKRLLLNPGSAGPPRYNLPPTVMKLSYSKEEHIFIPELIDLTV